MFGPLAALAGGGQVCDLDGGGSAADRRACQVLGCRLVMLVQAGGAGIGLHPDEQRKREKRGDYYRIQYKYSIITQVQVILFMEIIVM